MVTNNGMTVEGVQALPAYTQQEIEFGLPRNLVGFDKSFPEALIRAAVEAIVNSPIEVLYSFESQSSVVDHFVVHYPQVYQAYMDNIW